MGAEAPERNAWRSLVEADLLYEIADGLYVAAVASRFGFHRPHERDVADAYALRAGIRIRDTASTSANALGLSLHVPVEAVFLTDGPTLRLSLGDRGLFLRNAPSWLVRLPETRAGSVVAAVGGNGEATAEVYAASARKLLTEPEWREVMALADGVPAWVRALLKQA